MQRREHQELLILGWHNVESTWCFPARPGTGTQGLLDQLQIVRRFGNVVDLGQALDDLARGRTLPRRSVALTFDDGYRDNLTVAAPLLRRLGMPATFFLVPSFLARERTSWWETLAAAFQHAKSASLDWQGQFFTLAGPGTRSAFDIVSTQLKRLDAARREAEVSELVDLLEPSRHPPVPDLFMDWDDARKLVSQGAVLGSHSRDHAILANEAPDVQRENLADARRQLQDQLDLPIDLLAYPNGTKDDFDAASVNAAQHAGYRCGVTTIPGSNSASTSFYRLRRHVLFPERGRLGFKRVAKRTVLDSLFGAGTRA